MPSTKRKSTAQRRPAGKRRKSGFRRRTFMFDDETDSNVAQIQAAYRATTMSEAMRRAVRQMAELMEHVGKGGTVVITRAKKPGLKVDIPPATAPR